MKIKQKDINLYSEFIKTSSKSIKKNQNITLTLVTVFSLVLIAAVTLSVRVKTLNLQCNIEKINNDIQLLCESDELKNINAINEKEGVLEAAEDSIEALNEYIECTYPDIPADFIQNIRYSGNSVNIASYSYKSSENALSIEGNADSPSDISAFIKKLRDYGICSDIEYDGYTVSNDKYIFQASCVFSPKNDEEDEYND